MYVAIKYIGRDFTPGEVLPDGLPQAFLDLLLRKGAIRQEEAPQDDAQPALQDDESPEETDAGKALEEADAEEACEDAFEEPEAPIMDVADALEAPAKPDKRRRGK